MTLNVIGAGFGRTGTFSLKLALEQLGFGPCYHMHEVFGNPDHIPVWEVAIEGRSSDWQTILQAYRATVDWPTTTYWRELAALYPQAKIILTVREAEAWYASISQTIFSTQANLSAIDDPVRRAVAGMAKKFVTQGTFNGRTEDRNYVMQVYEAHNQAVQNLVEAERLLIFDVAEGWPPLCQFLGCPIPDEVFPHTNTKAAFQSRSQLLPTERSV